MHRSRAVLEDEAVSTTGMLDLITKGGLGAVGAILLYWLVWGKGAEYLAGIPRIEGDVKTMQGDMGIMRQEHRDLLFILKQGCVNTSVLAGTNPELCNPPR